MKKIITLLTAATLCLSLYSCGNSNLPEDDSSDAAVENVSSDSITEKTETDSSKTK